MTAPRRRRGAGGGSVSGRGLVGRFDDLAAGLGRAPARLGPVRAVAVDGPSGAGKSTFAGRLADALRAAAPTGEAGTDVRRPAVAVVHTDDLLDGWADQFTFWGRLEAGVLAPLRAGRPGRYPVYDWVRDRFAGSRQVPVPDVLIVEGATSARADLCPELTLSVFVDAPADLRWARALARDGAGVREPLARWMAAEEAYFAADRTACRVDLAIDGAPEVGHDPRNEFVRLRRTGDDHD